MNAEHGAQIDFGHWCWVFGGAVQDRQHGARCAGGLKCVDGCLDLAQICHASGKDDGFAEAADVAQVWQVRDFAGRNLKVILAVAHEQINAFDVKAGGEEADFARCTVGDKFMVHCIRQL